MRFRKTVKIAKGVKMNASTSGVSFTVGGKGISLNLGSKGVFLNTSIPGTGLYDRHTLVKGKTINEMADKVTNKVKEKVTGKPAQSGSKSAAKSGAKAAKAAPALPESLSFDMDETGRLMVLDGRGREITDEAVLRQVKKTEDYAQAQEALSRALEAQINGESDAIVNIHLQAAQVLPADQIRPQAPVRFTRQRFLEVEPSRQRIQARLEAEAQKEITGFFGVSRQRQEYVNSRLDAEYDAEYEAWARKKAEFEAEQDALERQANSARRLTAEDVQKSLSGDPEYVESVIDQWLGELELPVEFSVDYEYRPGEGAALIDLDLPEIEDLPGEKAVRLASGAVKAKAKTQKELREDYTRCVLGLSVFFASHFFAVTPCIQKIMIAGYTQRRDLKTGDLRDDYVYSIVYDRAQFEALTGPVADPVAFAQKSKNRMIPTANMELKVIEPYSWPEDAET